MLWRGEWDLDDVGVMDRTHLRWFTPKTYRMLFEATGFEVEEVKSISPLTRKQRIVSALMLGRREYLFWSQICLRGRKRSGAGGSA